MTMGDSGKKKQKKRGVLDSVVVPVGSAVVLGTAAVHSILDRRHENGTERKERLPDPEEATKGGLLDRVAQRFTWLEPIAAVQRRFSEVGGNFLAAAFTFNAFLSLFPLMLVGVAVLGYVAAGSDTDLAKELVNELGLKGEAAKMLTNTIHAAEDSRQAASIVGLAGLLWSGLGLVGALQYIYNSAWQVNDRGLKDKAVGLAWLGGAAVLFVASAAVTTVLRWLPGPAAPLGVVVGFAVSFLLWLWTARVLPNKQVPWRHLVPGALFGAVGLEILKLVGAYLRPQDGRLVVGAVRLARRRVRRARLVGVLRAAGRLLRRRQRGDVRAQGRHEDGRGRGPSHRDRRHPGGEPVRSLGRDFLTLTKRDILVTLGNCPGSGSVCERARGPGAGPAPLGSFRGNPGGRPPVERVL